MNRRTISGIPGWLEAGIADYQTKHEIQSWSQAVLELAIRGIIHAGELKIDVDGEGFFGGSAEAENELWDAYEASQDNGFVGTFEDWLITSLRGGWGSKREGAGRKITQ